MVQYIYFVKCPNCEDEHFDFFDDAKAFALGCLSSKPIITQTEVCRNDFGECTDHNDLGTVWSWEDVCTYTDAEPTRSIFTKDDLKRMADGFDPEFDNLDNSVDFEVEEPVTSEISAIDDVPDNFRKPKTLGEDLEYEFKPTELQKAKGEVFKLNGAQRFKQDETLPEIYALYKELVANSEDGKAGVISYGGGSVGSAYGDESQAEDFLNFYKTFTDLRNRREIEIDHRWDDNERRDLLTGAASIKFKSPATKDKLISECYKTKPIPEGMTIEELVEAMEENEDSVECVCCRELYPKEDCKHDEKHGWICFDCQDKVVECTWCEDLYDKSECRYEVERGWLCRGCQSAILSRGEPLTVREGSYWDFLDEDATEPETVHDLGNEYDGGYPADSEETLTEASLSDIVSAANNEFGSRYREQDLLDSAGVEDLDYFDELETPGEVGAELYAKRGRNSFRKKKASSMTEELEDEGLYNSQLVVCPECGFETLDVETGICINCGFNSLV